MTAQDRRETPRYTVAKAALYLGIPPSTVSAWVQGRSYIAKGVKVEWRPLVKPADKGMFGPMLSFFNIAELHVLASTRDYNVPVRKIRNAIKYLEETTGSPHPLVGRSFYTDGKDLFVKQLSQYINASQYGQIGLTEVLDGYVKKIVTDDQGLPIRIFPIVSKDFDNRVVCITPDVGSGSPVITTRGVRASVIWSRYKGGETISELADDYEMELDEIEQAINYVRYIKRAA